MYPSKWRNVKTEADFIKWWTYFMIILQRSVILSWSKSQVHRSESCCNDKNNVLGQN